MNKVQLINAVSKETGLKKTDAEAAVSSVFNIIEENLAKGEKVQIVGFGTFKIKIKEERDGRNPKTGEKIRIAASKNPIFVPGKSLKESVK
ncbi:MAG: HU family DNA-binding protein [Eubacteriales bacterium]|jgi:DNA-binding protein HU-beta|nr:HU family DNA-binding protein [Clostridiales bacterium]